MASTRTHDKRKETENRAFRIGRNLKSITTDARAATVCFGEGGKAQRKPETVR